MSENSDDELSALFTLTSSLSDKISESDDAITKINQIVKSLVSEQDYNRLIKDKPSFYCETKDDDNDNDDNEDDDEVIQLEQQRLQLAMELQKQDYISDKLQELVKENQELLDIIKDYISK
ncbi:hypothetical protein CANMA_000535 [Candida margitis]|uniref:uncharacterized protein n=1 Tax=Candida margitis TaxID=1775924 RepID=UPI002226B11E|nr:uncharacterized protein CANMA_000535 [Candida margitis]KAI5970372.1 hypothetical protein CANMA_000535 [Candida margitis]